MADMMYRLVLRFQTENQAELTKAIEGLSQVQIMGAKVDVQMGATGRTGSNSMMGLARSVMSVGFMFNMMESALMRQDMAAMMAENSQNRLSDAIARYGANSVQVRRAMKQNETELNYLNQANLRANVSMGLMATMLIMQSGLLETETRARIMNTAAKYAGAIASGAKSAADYIETGAIWLKNAALSVEISLQAMLAPYLVPIMLGAAAAVGVGIAAAYASKETGGYVEETKPYMLHAGEWVLPKGTVDTFTSKESFKSVESNKENTVNNETLTSKNALNTFASKETFKSLKEGGLIEKEGLYLLHTGEKVLSKESALSSTTNNVERSALTERVQSKESLMNVKDVSNTRNDEKFTLLSAIKESNSSNTEKSASTEKNMLNSLLSITKESNKSSIEKSTLNNDKTILNSLVSTMRESNTNNVEKSALKERFISPKHEFAVPSGGGSTLPTFNFETHLHVETDLDAALAEQNRRIKNEYRRTAS